MGGGVRDLDRSLPSPGGVVDGDLDARAGDGVGDRTGGGGGELFSSDGSPSNAGIGDNDPSLGESGGRSSGECTGERDERLENCCAVVICKGAGGGLLLGEGVQLLLALKIDLYTRVPLSSG